jgi:hypothetical protein
MGKPYGLALFLFKTDEFKGLEASLYENHSKT